MAAALALAAPQRLYPVSLVVALRRATYDLIEAAVAFLDALEPESDLEPEQDDERECEPSLGWPENECQEVAPGYGPGRARGWGANYRGFDPATLACGTDGRRCAHVLLVDLEDEGDTGIGDHLALDLVEQPGRWR